MRLLDIFNTVTYRHTFAPTQNYTFDSDGFVAVPQNCTSSEKNPHENDHEVNKNSVTFTFDIVYVEVRK